MDPVSAAASIIAVLQLSHTVLGSCYRFVDKAKDAASDIDRIIRQVGYLTTILQDLKDLTEPNGTQPSASNSSKNLKSLLGDDGPLTACARCLEELKLKLPSGPVRLHQKLKWPFESKKIKEILDRITAQIPILELALVGNNYGLTVAIKGSLEDAKLHKEREKVLSWLRCADPTVKYLASRKLYQPGSNHWVIESEQFKEWRDNAGQTLWLHGIPGAGKTIICSTIIDHLEEICRTERKSRLAYYYFDFSDQLVQKLDTVLRCLLWQLCKYEEYIPKVAWDLYESCDDGRKQPSDTILANTLFDILDQDSAGKAYIIFDALDEYPIESREHFFEVVLDRIEKHRQTAPYNFLFTSRKELDIEKRMTELNVKLHNLPVLTGDVNADVRLLVTQTISTHRIMKDWSKDLKSETEDRIASGAQGMFRWAVCQLDLIKNCRQAGAVQKTLKNLPKTLDATYDRILTSIPDETWQIARTALILLTYSVRPLTLKELAEAMVIDYHQQRFDPNEHRLTYYRHVLEICSSLISVSTVRPDLHKPPWLDQKYYIERRLPYSTWEDPFEVVQFAHFSVKEYMILERAKSLPRVSRFTFSPTVAHQTIAALSLVYLLDFSGGVRLTQIDFESFPFLAYAAQYWPEHWRKQLALEHQEPINGLIQRILDTAEEQSAYINFINICRPDALLEQRNLSAFVFSHEHARSLESIAQPLYYAAQLGHLQLCRWLLDERGCNVNAVGGTFGQAIQIAARSGHKNVVQLLLNRGAHINRRCGRYAHPLQDAAYGGHVGIIKLLLDQGAVVNAAGGIYGSALNAACKGNHLDAASVLIDRGADMDIACVREGTALNIAAKTRKKALVQLLLQKGAKINDVGADDRSALYYATLNGDLEMVRMLVAAGADVNSRSGYKYNPLQAACSNPEKRLEKDGKRYLEIARFLLKNGADPNMHGGQYGDALRAAIEGSAIRNIEDNNIDMVKLVLDHGGDINYLGGKYHSSIGACMSCGNLAAAHILIGLGADLDEETFLLAVEHQRKTVIPLLLEKGIDVNAQNESGTALQFAIKNKDEVTTKILLSHPDIDVNALSKTYEGITALGVAVRRKSKDVVKQLLDLEADVNQPSDGSTCLTAAVRGGDIEIVTLLLDHGADINANIARRDSALIVACLVQNEILVQFLLDRGADVNLQVSGRGDALQAAAQMGNESIVKLLLAQGADVKAPEGRKGSCLECAIMAKKPALIRLLLDAGAHVNFSGTLENPRGGTFGFGGPLSASISYKQDGLMQLLIDSGANVNWPGHVYRGTPLQEAAEIGDEDAVKLLLEHGADVNLIGGYHGSALACAILKEKKQRMYDKCTQLILEAGSDVNLQGGKQWGCPLGAAVHNGDISIVQKLLDLGADVNVPAGSYGSPLHIAIVERDLDIFRLLLSRGADPNFTSEDCDIPLAVAARSSRYTMFKELLDRGADPNLRDSIALTAAASVGNNEGILLLIKYGADIHAQEDTPSKILHAAIASASIDTVELLLSKGVDMNAFCKVYGNALMLVLENIHLDESPISAMVQILLKAGVNVKSPPSERHTSALQAAIQWSNLVVVDHLLVAGADVNAHDPRFGTALSTAAYCGKVEVMKKLVEMGADLTLSGEEYGSPLQAAAWRHSLAAVEYLLCLGVDVNQLSGKTGYALHAACREKSENGLKIIKMLLDHGADPNMRGGEYETALQAAASHGCLENVKLLLSAGADPTIEGGKYGNPLKAAMAEAKHYHVANYLRRYMASNHTTIRG